jgi:Spy/CpxP family protein refolding chaperone
MRNAGVKRIGVAAGAALTTVMVLALAMGAAAWPGGEGRGMGKLLDRLDFSDETRSSVEAVLERRRTEGEPLREAVQTERHALETLLAGESVDADTALAQVERVGEARTAFEKHRVLTGIEMRAVMSADERAAFDKARDQRKDRRQRMRGRFGRHGTNVGEPDALAWEFSAAPLP